MDLLNPITEHHQTISPEEIDSLSRLVEEKLREFRITVQVVGADCGPVITLFKLQPEPGTKSSQITNISTDLARSLLAKSVRVLEIIPGTTYIGLEIPNRKRETVFFREVIDSEKFRSFHALLPMALGVDVTGNPVVADLAEMPHLLVAGTTGSGKSVGVNTMIMSLLLSKTPDEVRFIMIDPKMLEFSSYNGIPHLLTPVVTDMKQASNALRWAVGEMERRYALMAKTGVKKLTEFNRKVEEARIAGTPLRDPTWQYTDSMDSEAPELTKLPFIVIVIDEFADMMMTVGKTVETLVARLAQKARAAGIHLVIATQSPRKNVLTGLIKTNIPSRLSFSVQSNMDSRIILDQGGAENLLGNGDMLFLPAGSQFPIRVHGAFVQNAEIERVTAEWRTRGEPEYVDGVTDENTEVVLPGESGGSAGRSGSGGQDELFDKAVELVSRLGRVSCSILQRNFGIGYPRAASLIDELEEGGIVSEPRQNGRRDVLTRRQGE
jgi:S-DNA-T family DNA segregation ATPase FtsK/SpoIIIE